MKVVGKIRNRDVVVKAPPSKAHTLRALIIGALAKGESTIREPLLADDQLNVIRCLKGLGVTIKQESGLVRVQGAGGRFSPSRSELHLGDSGVGMNFLTSAACLSERPVVLAGSKRLNERPIAEVVAGLAQLGCRIEYLEKDGFPPVKIFGGGIKGGVAAISGQKTSQYFSSIVISAPYAQKAVTLRCVDTMTERPYFDISLEMMAYFGISAENSEYKQINVPSGGKYQGTEITVEGDWSSASFFFLAAAVCASRVMVTGLNSDTKQGDRAFVELLAKMGCTVSKRRDGICVEGGRLTAIRQDMSNLPDLVPPIAVAAAFAEGTSEFSNIGHLRHKESDRPAVIAEELAKMGAEVAVGPDSLIIRGGAKMRGAVIDPHNDHRIAMSFAAAGLASGEQAIENEGCVGKSFPDFWERFEVFYQ